MNLLVRKIKDEDMPEVTSWFVDRKWPLPPVDGILPPTGFVAEKDGELYAAAWLYVSNSSLGHLEWMVTRPKSGVAGVRALEKVIEHIKEASNPHVKCIIQFLSNDRLSRIMEKRQAFKNAGKENLLVWTRKG